MFLSRALCCLAQAARTAFDPCGFLRTGCFAGVVNLVYFEDDSELAQVGARELYRWHVDYWLGCAGAFVLRVAFCCCLIVSRRRVAALVWRGWWALVVGVVFLLLVVLVVVCVLCCGARCAAGGAWGVLAALRWCPARVPLHRRLGRARRLLRVRRSHPLPRCLLLVLPPLQCWMVLVRRLLRVRRSHPLV